MLLRRGARRALRRERKLLNAAARAGDAPGFAAAAITSLRVAAAPHFPATPRALVGRDISELLGEAPEQPRVGDVIRQLFSSTDAAQFGAAGFSGGLLALQPELETILDQLEAKLQ